MGRCALTLESPRSLFMSIRSEDSREFNEIWDDFHNGQPAMYWFQGAITQGDFGVPAVVVKVLKSMTGLSDVAIGETVACYYSAIRRELVEDFRDALRSPYFYIMEFSTEAILGIPA